MDTKKYWENEYKFRKKDNYDDWLEKYDELIKNCKTKILDLGSGIGADTEFLINHGKKVVSADISKTALARLKESLPESEIIELDISKPLPFKDNSFDLIIANLSLHYFDFQTTINVMKEIRRILTNGGNLIARLNSKNDKNHGYGEGEKIEEDYYFKDNCAKRFFDTTSANDIFSRIGIATCDEVEKTRFGNPRKFIEVVATKK